MIIDQRAVIPAVGVSFCSLVDSEGGELAVGTRIEVVPQPDNPYDSNALAIVAGDNRLGYIPRAFAERVHADERTQGRVLTGHVVELRHIPSIAITEFQFADGSRAEKGVPAEEVLDLDDVSVFAVTDKGLLPVSGLRVKQRFDGQVLTWDNPVAGFSLRIDGIGEPGTVAFVAA